MLSNHFFAAPWRRFDFVESSKKFVIFLKFLTYWVLRQREAYQMALNYGCRYFFSILK
jgi:hypothetical protein